MWYVLQVKSGEELNMMQSLRDMGYGAMVPRENRLQRKGGGWITKEFVLFPCYVFVNLLYTAESYYKIKETPSFIQFLGSPDPLTYLEAEWIRILSFDGKAIPPARARILADGRIELLDDILVALKSEIKTVDKHSKKVVLNLSICNEPKELTLSFVVENEEQNLNDTEKSED